MPAEITEFKGNKMIVLRRSEDDRYPFQFGMSKAKLVLEHIKELEKFVDGEDLNKDEEEEVKSKEDVEKEAKDGEFI